MSFSLPRPVRVETRRLWLRHANGLAKTGSLVLSGLSIGIVLLVISAFAMGYIVESRAKKWSGELGKWDEYQKRKTSVIHQIDPIREVLIRKTQAYAAMQKISASLPPEVWLESWELESVSDQITETASRSQKGLSLVHRLSGFSLTESRIPEFLTQLEKTKSLGQVKLKSTERIKGEGIEQKTGIQANRKDLIRFQIGITE